MVKKESGWNNIAVVLVNYNGNGILQECIESLVNRTKQRIEVVVVDNGSRDGSMEFIENNYPYIHTIYMNQNIGWGAGCNIGMKVSFENGAAYVLLLNTDTEIEEGMIEELLKYCDGNTVSIPRIYRNKEDKENSLWYSGGEINFAAAIINQRLYRYDSADDSCNLPRKVEFATGCCMMISKETWQRAGGFDESFFLYYEDVDYCMRLKEQGIDIIYIPKAMVWHKVGGSAGGEISNVSQYYTVRNRLYFADRYKKYMKTDVLGIMKRIMQERAYFSTPSDMKYKDAVLAGITDYLCGVHGKAISLAQDNYKEIHGFSEKGVDIYGESWLWSMENEAEIEVSNVYEERKVCEVSGKICLTGRAYGNIVNIYWNEKFECSVADESEFFFIQKTMKSGEQGRIKFVVTENDIYEGIKLSSNESVFCVRNLKVKLKEYGCFVLGNGAYETEKNDVSSWNWIGRQNFYLYLINEDEKEREGFLDFSILRAPTHTESHVDLSIVGESDLKNLKSGKYQFSFRFKSREKKILQFHTAEEPVIGFNGDSRTFYYGMKDIHFRLA